MSATKPGSPLASSSWPIPTATAARVAALPAWPMATPAGRTRRAGQLTANGDQRRPGPDAPPAPPSPALRRKRLYGRGHERATASEPALGRAGHRGTPCPLHDGYRVAAGRGVEAGARRPVLLLQEASGDHRLLPVLMSIAEANAITAEQHHAVSLPRPDDPPAHRARHERVRSPPGTGADHRGPRQHLLRRADPRPPHPNISPGQRTPSPSPCTWASPIYAEDTVLDTPAVANTAIRADGDDHPPDEVEQFRRFLDTTSPEDFDPN